MKPKSKIIRNTSRILLAGSTVVIIGAILLFGVQLLDTGIKSETRRVLGISSTPDVLKLEKNQYERVYTSPEFKTDFGFNALAPHWKETSINDGSRRIEVSTSNDGKNWTRWMELEAGLQMRDDAPNPNRVAVETPVFIEGNYFQYKITLQRSSLKEKSPRISDVKFNYIDSRQSKIQQMTETLSTISKKVFAASGGPNIISRVGWESPDPYGDEFHGTDSYWEPTHNETEQIFLHHTVTENTPSDPEAVMRGIWDYHTNTLGWGDIGYNYVLDHEGNIYEGRFGGDNVTGGHVLNYNQGSMGVAVLGCFQSTSSTCDELNDGNITPPTDATLDSLSTLLSWKTTSFGIDPKATHTFCDHNGDNCLNLDTIAAHRDASNTACNGDLFYDKMSNIRQDTADKNNQDLWDYAAKQLSYSTETLSNKEVEIVLEFKNKGTATWSNDTNSNRILLKTANPYNRESSFQGSGWVDNTTPAVLDQASVATGETGTFTFNMKRPGSTFGDFFEGLKLVSENNVQMENYFALSILATAPHPSGTLIQDSGDKKVYRIEDGQRRHVVSREAFVSHEYSFDRVREATVADMNLPEGNSINFREGALVKGSDDPVYVINYDSNGNIEKRHVTSREVLEGLGLSFDEVLEVSDSKLPSQDGSPVE